MLVLGVPRPYLHLLPHPPSGWHTLPLALMGCALDLGGPSCRHSGGLWGFSFSVWKEYERVLQKWLLEARRNHLDMFLSLQLTDAENEAQVWLVGPGH